MFIMADLRRGRNFRVLGVLVLLAFTYMALLAYRHTLTGIHRLDGAIGVLFGLYICSRPAANLVDFLFFGRYRERGDTSRQADILWLGLNILVFAVGWLVIVIGTTRFTTV
jgi:hypothetical protein